MLVHFVSMFQLFGCYLVSCQKIFNAASEVMLTFLAGAAHQRGIGGRENLQEETMVFTIKYGCPGDENPWLETMFHSGEMWRFPRTIFISQSLQTTGTSKSVSTYSIV